MTAVSQSYPNYLGGLNEQPDELKKPGQLVEAVNVIPDPVIGLTRRPGFKSLGTIPGADPTGTWFEIERSNQINDDYIYFGCVNRNGTVRIVNQDGEKQTVKYTATAVKPHLRYTYDNNKLTVISDNDEEEVIEVKDLDGVRTYFKHRTEAPLKYCVSKDHVIMTNPTVVPSIDGRTEPTEQEKTKYYSFINLKTIDTSNYNYVFRLFFEKADRYRYIKEIKLDSVDDILGDYDKDLTLPLQTNGPFRFTLNPKDVPPGGSSDPAEVEVTFTGQIVQLKSDDGDGYRNEARYTWKTKLITSGKGFKKNEVYRETLSRQDAGGSSNLQLTFKINEVQSILATENKEIKPSDLSNSDAEKILSDLATDFKNTGGLDKAIVVGNGIYLENDTPFSVSTAEPAVADVMNSQKVDDDVIPIVRINTVAELPLECYTGFIVEVTNSFDNQNNYYLEYKAESETSDLDLTKADGYWEEVKKPLEVYSPEVATLPHMITIARTDKESEFTFIVSPMDYANRTAGTVKNNPTMFRDQAPITAVNYYKNRLFFFTNTGTVISSRAGEINNLFLNTAVSTSLIDPIDVVANSNQRVPIHGSAVINNGLVLFGDSEQYSVTTNSDLLTSDTVNVTKISNYTFDSGSNPIYLGTNLGFVSSGMSRFYEMTNIYDRGPVDINERSQQIQTLFGSGFNMPVSSREQSMVLVYNRYNTTASKDMLIYRFRQENSQDSSQTSWVKWRVDRNVAYASLPQDKVFLFVSDGRDPELYMMDSTSTADLPATGIVVPPRFVDGYTTPDDPGKEFETIIKFPTIYARSGGTTPKSDYTAHLTIHRVKMSTSIVGPYNLEIDRLGYDPYEILVEQTPADKYAASPYGFPPFVEIESRQLQGHVVETVPIYTRNVNLSLTIRTKFDAPFTLNSMTWEGDYNRPNYRLV